MNPWWVLALVVALVLVLTLVVVLVLRRRGAASAEEPLQAEPEDRPMAAVVANPIRVEPGTRARITATCTSLGWAEPLWLETTVDDPGTGQARTAVEQGADVVLACGGDGTVRSVAQALAGTGVAMGLVPMGTGNLLAKEVGVPSDTAAATRVALTGDDRTIDVGRIRVDGDEDERVFLVMAGTGLDAVVMENTALAKSPSAVVIGFSKRPLSIRPRPLLVPNHSSPRRSYGADRSRCPTFQPCSNRPQPP